MYTIYDYGSMIRDQGRTSAYARAIRALVKPDSVVLDIGTGTGIWAFLACQCGARKVYAVEPDDIVHLAREAAADNGLSDRIEFIQALSTEIELPERADLIVAEIHGALPLFRQSVQSLLDARDRMLAPGGLIIPRREGLWAAILHDPELHRKFVGPWVTEDYGLNLRAFYRRASNDWHKFPVGAERLLTKPVRWAALEYLTLDSSNVSGSAAWTVEHGRTAHGLCVWFDTELTQDICFSTSPLSPEAPIFPPGFFPWPEAVSLVPGDRVSAELRADYVGGDYVWSWRTRIQSEAGTEKASFDQSTFYSLPLASGMLRKRAHTFQPRLNHQGQIDLFVLERMAAGLALGEIASELCRKFPAQFKRWQAALDRVAALSATYSE